LYNSSLRGAKGDEANQDSESTPAGHEGNGEISHTPAGTKASEHYNGHAALRLAMT